MPLPAFSYVKDHEPGWADAVSLAPFVLSQTFADQAAAKLYISAWHGIWVIPLSLIINVVAAPLLLLAAAVNALASVIMRPLNHHRLNCAHDCLLYAGISFARIFWPPLNPLKVITCP